jgi:hypothetical protein
LLFTGVIAHSARRYTRDVYLSMRQREYASRAAGTEHGQEFPPGVRFPDSAGFVASVFQAFVGDFRPKLL